MHNTCGHCKWYSLNVGCKHKPNMFPAYGQQCKFSPSLWVDKHEGEGRIFGQATDSGESFHVTHEGEKVKNYTTIRTSKGAVTFKKGGTKKK